MVWSLTARCSLNKIHSYENLAHSYNKKMANSVCAVNESAFEKAEPPSEWILVTVIVVGVGGRGA